MSTDFEKNRAYNTQDFARRLQKGPAVLLLAAVVGAGLANIAGLGSLEVFDDTTVNELAQDTALLSLVVYIPLVAFRYFQFRKINETGKLNWESTKSLVNPF